LYEQRIILDHPDVVIGDCDLCDVKVGNLAGYYCNYCDTMVCVLCTETRNIEWYTCKECYIVLCHNCNMNDDWCKRCMGKNKKVDLFI
jgi:hypothetical protein